MTVAIVLVAADRVTWWIAREIAVHQFTTQVPNVTGAKVQLNGFPFIPQLMARRLDHVTGSADTATIGTLDVTDVEFELRGVQTVDPFTVDYGVAAGVVDVGTLEEIVNRYSSVPIAMTAHDGVLTAKTTVRGIVIAVDGQPVLTDQGVGITVLAAYLGPVRVDMADLPRGVGSALEAVSIPVRVPDRVSIDSVHVLDGALHIQVSGRDVGPDDLVGT